MAETVAVVGVVGVGTMGTSLSAALAAVGLTVVVFDVDPERTKGLEGVTAAQDLGELCSACDLVLLSLPTLAAVEETVHELVAAAATLRAKPLIIDTSTTPVDFALAMYKRCHDVGIRYLDAPVSGRPPTLTMFVGAGDDQAYNIVRACISRIATVTRAGGPGQGCVMKLVNQWWIYTNFITVARGLVVARRYGLEPGRVLEALLGTAAASEAAKRFGGELFSGTSFDDAAGGPLKLIAKDLAFVEEMVGAVGGPVEAVRDVRSVFDEGVTEGLGDKRFSVVVQLIEGSVVGTYQAPD